MEEPMFSTGTVVGKYDYRVLMRYIEEVRERRGADAAANAIPSSDDITYAEQLVRSGVKNVSDLLEKLTERFLPRVHVEEALAAVREGYGAGYSGEEAARKIARLLAGWCIEICETLGILRIREPWRRSNE